MNQQKKNVTCAALIKTPSGYLIVHPTGNDHWSLPKGICEIDETPSAAAIREVQEETGFQITESMIDFGRFSYTNEKDIHIFFTEVSKEIDLSKLKCESFFTPKKTSLSIPEVDDYRIVSLDELTVLLNPLQRRIISSFKLSSDSRYLVL